METMKRTLLGRAVGNVFLPGIGFVYELGVELGFGFVLGFVRVADRRREVRGNADVVVWKMGLELDPKLWKAQCTHESLKDVESVGEKGGL